MRVVFFFLVEGGAGAAIFVCDFCLRCLACGPACALWPAVACNWRQRSVARTCIRHPALVSCAPRLAPAGPAVERSGTVSGVGLQAFLRAPCSPGRSFARGGREAAVEAVGARSGAAGEKRFRKKGPGLAEVIYLSYICTRNKQGSLAQLVQSVCLTSRGSGVRIPQLPRIYYDKRSIIIVRFFLCPALCKPACAGRSQKGAALRAACRRGVCRFSQMRGLRGEFVFIFSGRPASAPHFESLSSHDIAKKIDHSKEWFFCFWQAPANSVCTGAWPKQKASADRFSLRCRRN